MVSSISPHTKTHHEALLDISEELAHSSSVFRGLRLFPPSIKFIIWNEFCERFSFYGKAILALFLSERLGLSQVRSTEMFHLFTMACYASPLLGAVISDSLLGKFRTILYLSLLYAVGNWVMSMAAIPDPNPVTHKASSYSMWSTAMGLLFIAIGTGGIKPCVSAFGGDQIEFSMLDGQTKERLQRIFFSAFYFAISVGAFLSMLLTPLLRANVSYATAFGIPALLMGFARIIFWSGRGDYVDRRAVGCFFSSFIKVIISAVRPRKKESGYVNCEQVNCTEASSSAAHWLDAAKLSCSAEEVEDVKTIIRICVFLLPAPLFWCLYNQKASTWVFQAKQMNGHVSWLGNVVIRPDQMQALDPLLVLIFIPLLDQVPQYVLLTAAEVIFSVTGLEFSYSQPPVSMKSVVQAIWHLTSAEGDLITILVVGIIGNQLSTANRSFLFAAGGIVGLVFMIWLGACFKDADNPIVEKDSGTVNSEVESSIM
eukprot:PITA_09753